MSKIKFPNTQDQPTDGTFKHEHNGRVWVWNGIVWKEPEDDTISYDESEQSLTYVNKLGKVKKVNLNFTKASSLNVLADTLENNLPDTSGSSNTLSLNNSLFNSVEIFSNDNTDSSSISRISSVLTDKINQINSRIDQITSSQNKLKNSLGGENYTPLYPDTNSLMGDFDKLKEQINNLKQKESDIKSLVDSIKSSISSDPNFSSMDSAGNSIKETILNLSQRMEQIKSVVTSSGIGPDTDVASIITELYQTRAQLLANQSSALDTDALDQIPVIQEKIDKIQQSLGLDDNFEYNPKQSTVSTVKGHVEDLYASKIESSRRGQPSGIASINTQGRIEQEKSTFIEYDPDTNTLKYFGESSLNSNSGSQTLGLFDNHVSQVPSQEVKLSDIPTKMTYNEFEGDVNVLRYYNEDEDSPPNIFNVKGAITELKISDDKTKLLYTDESGGDPKEILLPTGVPELKYDEITDKLVFSNGVGKPKSIPYPRNEKLTSLRYDAPTSRLIYKNEADQEFKVEFPDTVTSFRVEENQLIYRDELGVDNQLNLPEIVTELSRTDDGKLKYKNEDSETPDEIIDVRTNKVHMGQVEPTVKYEGLLWFQETQNQETQEYTSEMKVWNGTEWKSATYDSTIANRIVSSTTDSFIHAKEGDIIIGGNVQFNGDFNVLGKLSLNLPSDLTQIFDELELTNPQNLQLKLDYIDLGNMESTLSLGVLDEGLTFDGPNSDKYTPKLTVNQHPVLSSSNREYQKDKVTYLDTSVNYHFIKTGSKTVLMSGRYIGHELTLVVNEVDGALDPENCPKVFVFNATYTKTLHSPSNPNSHYGGMTAFTADTDEVGKTLSELKDGVSIGGPDEVTWCLYELRPAHRQEIGGEETEDGEKPLKWVYRNTSKTIYNCIWDGQSWILNGGTVIPTPGSILALENKKKYWEQ